MNLVGALTQGREIDHALNTGQAIAVDAKLEGVGLAWVGDILGLDPESTGGRGIDRHRFALEYDVNAVAGAVIKRSICSAQNSFIGIENLNGGAQVATSKHERLGSVMPR